MDFGVAFGGAITQSLILYGEFLECFVFNPSYVRDGVSQTWDKKDLNIYGFGPGAAYYFVPLNLYLSGTLLFPKVLLNTNASPELTDRGIGASLMLGKEWWNPTDDWGFGVAAQFFLGSARGHADNARWTSLALAIVLSATYN